MLNNLLNGLAALLGFLYFALVGFWIFLRDAFFPILGILLLILAALLLVAVLRTLLQGRKHSTYHPNPSPEKEALCAEKLSTMIRCETTSHRDISDPDKFRRFPVHKQYFSKTRYDYFQQKFHPAKFRRFLVYKIRL
jgi:hypothetical protein